MTSQIPAEQRPAFHLKTDKTIEGEQFVTNFFNSLFDIKKLVLVKQSHKDKHLIKEVVIILNSQNNIEMLSQGFLSISDSKFSCREIPVDEAEQLIRHNKTKLYVGNIPKGVDNIKLWKHFARFGALDYTYIIKKPDRNSRGFGFIIYEERESFERAVKSKHYIDGQRLICKLFLNKSQLTKHTKADPQNPSEHETACDGKVKENQDILSNLNGSASEVQEHISASFLNCLDDDDDVVDEQSFPKQTSEMGPMESSADCMHGKQSLNSTDSSGKPASSHNDTTQLGFAASIDQEQHYPSDYSYDNHGYPTQQFSEGYSSGYYSQSMPSSTHNRQYEQNSWHNCYPVYQTHHSSQYGIPQNFGYNHFGGSAQNFEYENSYSQFVQQHPYERFEGWQHASSSKTQRCEGLPVARTEFLDPRSSVVPPMSTNQYGYQAVEYQRKALRSQSNYHSDSSTQRSGDLNGNGRTLKPFGPPAQFAVHPSRGAGAF
jgi:RNA recognition motif-containing protein